MDAAVLACTCTAAEAAYVDSYHYRAVRIGRGGAVLEPANGAFNVTVAPGANVQAAVDACPRGGCVLLLPGTHAGPLVLTADQEVHVFGRGLATMRTISRSVVLSEASKATIDGLIIRHEGGIRDSCSAVRIPSGNLRLQASDVSSASCLGISIGEWFHSHIETNATIVGCRCA